jgi:hypothetical protein
MKPVGYVSAFGLRGGIGDGLLGTIRKTPVRDQNIPVFVQTWVKCVDRMPDNRIRVHACVAGHSTAYEDVYHGLGNFNSPTGEQIDPWGEIHIFDSQSVCWRNTHNGSPLMYEPTHWCEILTAPKPPPVEKV